MSGSQFSMRYKGSIRSRGFAARLAFAALFLFVWIPLAFAQEPPLDVPLSSLPGRDPTAISFDGWRLYPTLRLYTLYSDNLFLSPTSRIAVPAIGVTPSVTAEWTNGIHTTTLYGNLDREAFPTDEDINTLDGRAGFTQKYEAMRDLIFSVNGNYVHQTLSTGLTNSIQSAQPTPGTAVLPNGNTQLPNGTIVSPSGQVVGQANPAIGSVVPLVVDPSDQFTGTFSVQKIFNRGILNLSGTLGRTEYEQASQSSQSLQSNRSKTFAEHAAFWLGPMLYAYSDGTIGTTVTDPTPFLASTSTTSYRAIGGIGTRQIGLFRGSAYFGHQGSEGSTTGGGEVYGGSVSYYPTPRLTLAGTVDQTTNVVTSQTLTTNLALTLPGLSAVQIPLGASTHITSTSLLSTYEFTPRWFANCQLGYTRIEYIGIPRVDDSWLLDATLRYDIWHDMSITWEYRYRNILSNASFVSATSNTGTMGATYKF
jgi:Putative beta-barrel porin 2